MAIKIALDAGHGLNTSGKQTPDGIKEWTLNDNVRDKVVTILADYDCEVIHTDNNEGKTDESLASRLSKYKSAGVSAFVSIHHNAYKGTWGNATGVEVYTDKNPTAGDSKLAKLIYDKLVKYTCLKGRGVKQSDFYVINQDSIPAVLVEGGFMDGTADYKIITSDSGQNGYAKAVAEGLIEFLNLKKKATTTTAPAKTTTYKAGQSVKLSNTQLYASATTPKVSSNKTGTFYLWSSEVVAGRIRITNSTANVGKTGKVTGWINVSAIGGTVATTTTATTSTTTKAPSVAYFKKYTGTSGSITTALKSIGATATFTYRAKIAKANDIKAYLGTASQNTKMLTLLKQGKLIKP